MPDKEDEKKWLTVREVAAELRTHVATVYRWVKSGELPGVTIGRTVRIKAADFRALLRRIQEGGRP